MAEVDDLSGHVVVELGGVEGQEAAFEFFGGWGLAEDRSQRLIQLAGQFFAE